MGDQQNLAAVLLASNRGAALVITPRAPPGVWKVAFQTFNVREFTFTGREPELGRTTGRHAARRTHPPMKRTWRY
jgi:hypothetical protein